MTRPLAAVRGWLALVGSAALALQPLLGLLLLGVAAVVPRGLRWQRLRWAALLAAPLLLPVPFQLLAGQPVGWLLYQALVVLLMVVVCAGPWKQVERGLLVGIVGLVVIGSLTLEARSRLLVADGAGLLTPFLGVSTLGPRDMYWSVAKEWRAEEGAEAVRLVLDLRLAGGAPGTDWYRYHPLIEIAPCAEAAQAPCSRVSMPDGVEEASGRLVVSRELDTGAPLAGRTFRVRARLRSGEGQTTSGCSGMVLRDNGGRLQGACAPVALTPGWREHTLEWSVPDEPLGTELRVDLSGITGTFEVADVVLEERLPGGWRELGPLEPAGLQVAVRGPGASRRDVPAHTLLPTPEWRRHSVELATRGQVADGVVRVTFLLEGAVGVEVRNLELYALGGDRALEPLTEKRWVLGFGQANLLGHSAAVIGGGIALLGSSVTARALGLLAALVLVVQSGSRTALLALLVVVATLVFGLLRGRARLALVGAVAVGAALLLATAPGALDRFFTFSDGNNATRGQIWSVAVDALRERPLLGLGDEGFGERWVATGAGWSNTAPSHAHNFVLQLASGYGVPGAVAAVGFLVSLACLAWRRTRWRGLALLLAVLVLNTFDFTLFFSGVLGPLLLITEAGRSEVDAAGPGSREPGPTVSRAYRT